MKRYRIKELGDIVTGNTPSKKNLDYYNSEDIPFFKPDSLDENEVAYLTTAKEYLSSNAKSVARIVPRETVLFSCIGSIGKIGITNVDNSSFNQQINAIIPNKEIILPKYLCYALKYNKKKIQAIANAAVVPIINKTQFSEFEISIHQKEEQVKVVNILDQAQELIDKRKAQIEALDELIQSLFYDMFGDPFNKADSNLRSLNEYILLNPKKSEVKDLDLNFEVSFVPMECVGERGELNLSHTRILADVYKGFTYFKNNDVLFAKITPCMENGKGTVAKNLINGIGFGSTEFHVLRPIKDISNPIWLYHLTRLDSFRKLAENQMTGSAGQKRVPTTFFTSLKVIVPSIELQNQFAEIVENIEKQKELLNESLVELENNFNSLMERAFNGGPLR